MNIKPNFKWAHNAGFTLIELAISIFVITLLLGAILVPLATQVEQRQVSETQKSLDDAKEALIGFAVANSYLPCPDTTGDGVSDPATPGVCPSAEGFFPWVTLNTGRQDAWGNHLRYRVSPEFTNVPSNPCTASDGRIGLCKTGNITVSTRDSVKNIATLAGSVPVVILSHGKNGYGATSSDGAVRPVPPAINVDETLNADPPGTTFLSRTPSASGTACSDAPPTATPYCEFDDIAVWLSSYALFSRMVAAGKLP